MEKALAFAKDNEAAFIETLKNLVRIPSVSFNGYPPEEVVRSAEAIAKNMTEIGLQNVEILKIPGAHPYVYGDWLKAPGKPTLLLYAHHDVQPPMTEEIWKTPPFEPTLVGDRLFGRGAADDKAGYMVHAAAIESYLRSEGKLPLNIKFIVEGEEEIGSGHLEAFLSQYKDKMAADAIVLTDTSNFEVGLPSITTSLRGLVEVRFKLKALKSSKHSGMWGGPCPDPGIAMAKLLGSIVNEKGIIQIPGIYDKVRPLNETEKQSYADLNYSEERYRKEAEVLPNVSLLGDEPDPLRKIWRLPSFSVNALEVGKKIGSGNVVNDSAWARITMRIVPDMDVKETTDQIISYLKDNVPFGCEFEIEKIVSGDWWFTNPEGEAFSKAKRALSKAFDREAVYIGCGGTIPFISPFAKVLGGVPCLLIGIEDPYTNAHSENESLHLGDFKKAINGAIYLYEELAE